MRIYLERVQCAAPAPKSVSVVQKRRRADCVDAAQVGVVEVVARWRCGRIMRGSAFSFGYSSEWRHARARGFRDVAPRCVLQQWEPTCYVSTQFIAQQHRTKLGCRRGTSVAILAQDKISTRSYLTDCFSEKRLFISIF
eukprot:6195725-Pleurochrysis_carterae.AAC.5